MWAAPGATVEDRLFADALDLVLRWQSGGATWVHLVDLDRAFGRGENSELLHHIIARLDIDVELSGGIRDHDSLAAALDTGCRRAVIAASALADPAWCTQAIREHGDRVALGLDVRGTTLAPRGTTQDGGDLSAVLERLEAVGCARYVVTDVARDGKLHGPNLALLRDVCDRTTTPVIASGGVSTLEDLRALSGLAPVGVEGAIVGAALHTGAFSIEAALAAVANEATGPIVR